MPSSPRDRLIATTIAMLAERGPHGAGLSDLLVRSKVARASIYQHFTSKDDLVATATRTAGRYAAETVHRRSGTTPAECVDALVDWMVDLVDLPDGERGCPLAAVTASGEPLMATAAGEVFAEWTDSLTATLTGFGIPAENARSLAVVCLSAVEGAGILARASRSNEPLETVRTHLHATVAAI